MRTKPKPFHKYRPLWESWFAWHPVKLYKGKDKQSDMNYSRWVWLERLERMWHNVPWEGYWEYRPFHKEKS